MTQATLEKFKKAQAWVLNGQRQSIEIDCAPGNPRPDDLIGGVITGLGLEVKEPCSRVFGNWEWDYSDVPAARWAEIKPVIKERITKLYNSGVIRYGSW